MALAEDIRDWLRGDKCRCIEVVPCRVKLLGMNYVGCHYTQVRSEGNSPVEIIKRSIYVAGSLPPKFIKRHRQVFTLEGDKRPWFIAGYYPDFAKGKQGDLKVDFYEYHPFGHNFILSPWTAEGKIEDGERFPYHYSPLVVEDMRHLL